jgi:hypothetical protein
VDIDEVISTGRFDFERAQQAPGWLQEMRGEHVPETWSMEYQVSVTALADRFTPRSSSPFSMTQRPMERCCAPKATSGWRLDQNMRASGAKRAE